MTLYKYIKDTSIIESVIKGNVKFSPIPELNDPSELVPALIPFHVEESRNKLLNDGYSEEDMVYLRKQGKLLERLAPKFKAISVPETAEQANQVIKWGFYNQTEQLEKLLIETAKLMSSNVGLLCLSKRFDSLPMWAHYTDNAKGVAIEFVNLEDHFQGDETGILNELIEVRYEVEKIGVTFDPSSHESIFFSKFHDWKYEEEVRIVRPFDECEFHSDKHLYLHQIPTECISRIILGWNVPTESRKLVKEIVRSVNPKVGIVEAHFDKGKLELR